MINSLFKDEKTFDDIAITLHLHEEPYKQVKLCSNRTNTAHLKDLGNFIQNILEI